MTETEQGASELRTLSVLPFHVAGRFPKQVLIERCHEDESGHLELSSREFFDRVRDLSLGLSEIGVESGDRVAIMSESRPEWLISDFSALTCGAVAVPIYPTLPERLVRYILSDSAARVVVVSDEIQAAKVRSVASHLSELQALIVMEQGSESVSTADLDVKEYSFSQVSLRGHERLMTEDGLARKFKEIAFGIKPAQLATIIYTSGTTGDPKGVMLSHGNIASNIKDAETMIVVTDSDHALSFLPLSHVFEMMVVCLYLYKGVTISFAESIDTVARDLSGVKPTIMTGVPRLYEKLYSRIHEAVSSGPQIRRYLFDWAIEVGHKRAHATMEGRPASLMARLEYRVADQLVLSKIRDRLGGRIRFLVSGSAPLGVDTAEFLFAIGTPVLEGYGLTETSPVLTVNSLSEPKLGTVGRVIPNVELKVAEDGEILAKGPNVMGGYYGKPSATREAIIDGWFHTGDIGSFDAEGYLTITDRKKEIIVTAAGKNVAPAPIESRLKKASIVAEAILVGDRRRFVGALLVPDFEILRTMLDSVSPEVPLSEIVKSQAVIDLFNNIVRELNADLPGYEQIKRFALLPAEFGISTGELTPTMKVKRKVVSEKWAETINSLYER